VSFTEQFRKPKVDVSFLSNDMNEALYRFLLENGGIPKETEITDLHERADFVVPYRPWKDDILTSYKSILFAMILTQLYPWDNSNSANIYLDQFESVNQIYEKRKIPAPSEEQIRSIRSELNRVAIGYAKAVLSVVAGKQSNGLAG
jgi:hypothetical protein